MLVYSNFYNNASSLIYEDTEGLVTCAYALRSGNKSSVTSLYNTRPKIRNNVLFNIPQEDMKIVTYLEKGVLMDRNNPQYSVMRKNHLNLYSK